MKAYFDISEEQELKILNAKSQFSDYVVMLPKEYTDLCETSCFNYLFLLRKKLPSVFLTFDAFFIILNKISSRIIKYVEKRS